MVDVFVALCKLGWLNLTFFIGQCIVCPWPNISHRLSSSFIVDSQKLVNPLECHLLRPVGVRFRALPHALVVMIIQLLFPFYQHKAAWFFSPDLWHTRHFPPEKCCFLLFGPFFVNFIDGCLENPSRSMFFVHHVCTPMCFVAFEVCADNEPEWPLVPLLFRLADAASTNQSIHPSIQK